MIEHDPLAALQGENARLIALLEDHGNAHPLDVTFIDEEDQKEPWKRSASVSKKLVGPMPKSLTVTLANRLIRLAAFQNPEFYKKQAMRFSVWDEPRVIGCAENYPYCIAAWLLGCCAGTPSGQRHWLRTDRRTIRRFAAGGSFCWYFAAGSRICCGGHAASRCRRPVCADCLW
jgi:hypothetical protein